MSCIFFVLVDVPISDYDNVKEVRISREELYEQVWSERLSDIIKKYYISENGLIKKCREWNIPLPNLKYWIKLKDTTNPPERIPLPKYSGYDMEYFKLREDYERTKESIQKKIFSIKKEIEEDPKIDLMVPEKLSKPDPIIIAAKNEFYKKKVWREDQGLIYGNFGQLSFHVSPNQMPRAMRFMDTLIKAMRTREHQFVSIDGVIHIIVFGQEYWILCKEKQKRVLVKDKYGTNKELKPTGLLSLQIGESYHSKEWSEGKSPIEEKVASIVASIEYRGWKDREDRIEMEKQWAINAEKERIEKELQSRKEKEFSGFLDLFKKAERHEKAEVIRRYIQNLEDYAITNNKLTEELKGKIEWARKKADWYDPFIESHDELLIDVDRENLTMKKRGYW